MAEVLSCLLAVGVVLVWLVLFHLLVNVWLLCVFTSLLVVLGGWLGSQAALESNSVVVHLERFIPLEQVEGSSDDEPQLDQEIENTVKKIIRDFVSSWYTTVSTETSFQTEVQEAMVLMGLELKARARRVDHKMLTKRTLDLCGGHLQSYLKAKEAVERPDSEEEEELLLPSETPSVDEEERRHAALWRAYSSHGVPHPAVRSAATEVNYSRSVTDLLLHVLVPPPHLESRTGRLIVGELITCNVLYPLITKLSDPDWLNILLIEVFAKSKSKSDQQQPEELAGGSTQQPISSSPPLPPPTTLLPPALPSSPAAQSPEPPPRQLQENNKPAGLQNFQKYPETPPTSPMTPRVEMPTPTDAAGTTVPPLDLPAVYDTVDSEDTLYCPQNNHADEEEPGRTFLRRYLRPGKSNPFYQENDSDLDSPSADYKQSSTDSLLMMVQEEGVADMWKESTTPTDLEDDAYNGLAPVGHPKVLVNSEPLELACVCDSLSPPQRVEGDSQVPSNLLPARELLLVGGVEHVGVGGGNANNNELGVVSPLKPPSPSFSFEPLSSPEGPVIIQNLRIAGTITAKEHRGTGSHPYTLYTIKYETVVGCENPASLQQQGSEDTEESTQVGCDTTAAAAALPAHPVAYHTVNTAVAGLPAHPVAYHTVNRRYSEFLNLQTRLEEKADLRKLIKGVKGPKKIFPDMPFGNMDTDKIEARKGLLETFVKQLCAIPETANSEEMQEFLALNTDARIAFVKKPFIVSRIDKIVVNAIVDTLKTAFPPRSEPQSPTEDNEDMDGGKITDKNKNKSRLRFTSKGGPFMNGSDVRPQLLFGWGQSRMVISGMSPGELEDFISEQERLLVLQDPESEREDCLSLRDVGGVCGCQKKNSLTDRENQQIGIVSETALAETALDVLCLLVKRQWSWLCTQNIQRTIRLLFGTFIDKWLEVGVANLTCTQYWVSYLKMLQEAVWPGGVLPSQPRPQRSPRQKEETKQQALSSLLKLVPDLVTDMLGSDKYKLSWQTAHQSLQNPIINRHLVYCICDLLLEFLVPEMLGEDFQRSLLQGLSKSPA